MSTTPPGEAPISSLSLPFEYKSLQMQEKSFSPPIRERQPHHYSSERPIREEMPLTTPSKYKSLQMQEKSFSPPIRERQPHHYSSERPIREEMPPTTPSELHQNFRVPHRLRLVNQAAYEPELISIGPYHTRKEHLWDMNMTKDQCWMRIGQRKGTEIIYRCLKEMKNMEATIRQWYRVPEAFISKDDLAVLMVIDGCFIIELLCREPQDLMSKLQWSRAALFGDLLLLENQLPFFVLVKLYGLIKDSTDGTDFAPQALDKLIRMLPGPNIATADLSTIKDTNEIHHLLGLIHDNWVPSPPGIKRHREYVEIKKAEAEGQEKKRQQDIWKFILCAIAISKQKKLGPGDQESGTANKDHWKFICFSREKAKGLGERVGRQSIRCARELEEAGIGFIKVDCGSDEDDSNQESYAKSLFDVEFTGGKMKIPTLVIGDYTERLFRNLIAYELYVQGSTYVIDYVTLMDNLVNTANDVQLLRLCGVIVNMLGDDEAVAQMLNKLRDCVTLCGETFYYEEMFVDVKLHCATSWNTWKAKLRHDYFSTPWTRISFAAALLVFMTTIIQFILSFFKKD